MRVSYEKLWKLLIDRNLQKKVGISWNTVTKIAKGEIVSAYVRMNVCWFLHCNEGDIVDFIENESAEI